MGTVDRGAAGQRTKTRIGVLAVGGPTSGGVHQYELSVLDALSTNAADFAGRFSFALFYSVGAHLPVARLSSCGWSTHRLPSDGLLSPMNGMLDPVRRVVGTGALYRQYHRLKQRRDAGAPPAAPDEIRTNARLAEFFRRHEIDLMLYPTPTSTSFEAGVPFVMAIHDLQHRLQPEFPEVSADGEWDKREYLFANGARRATLLVADSEVGKEDILNCYGHDGVSAAKVAVLPFVPPPYFEDVSMGDAERVRSRSGLPERFFFYPAQFWPHKNHVRIVDAVGRLKNEHALEVHVAFTGTAGPGLTGQTASQIAEMARHHQCSHLVHSLKYLSPREMSALYKTALGLVMPTFFGPTNIPVLEAWQLGCPVLTSDIRGVREQVGDAGVLVDPSDVDAIAEGMRRLATDDALRADLERRGLARVMCYTPDDFADRLGQILETASEIVLSSNGRASAY